MKTVTAIEARRNRTGRVNVFLDGDLAFSLGAPVAAEAGLGVGKVLTEAEVARLPEADRGERAREAALRLLALRPRSVAELKTRLLRRGFDVETAEQALGKLEEQHLVDDEAFARFWMENRETFSPRSPRLLRLEMKRKGLADETIMAVISEVDEEQSAYRAAQRKLRGWKELDYQGFRKRANSFLRQRGFSYEVVSYTVGRLWCEHMAQS
ncbi:regulatory protein RecX [Chloroflexota bacterium]